MVFRPHRFLLLLRQQRLQPQPLPRASALRRFKRLLLLLTMIRSTTAWKTCRGVPRRRPGLTSTMTSIRPYPSTPSLPLAKLRLSKLRKRTITWLLLRICRRLHPFPSPWQTWQSPLVPQVNPGTVFVDNLYRTILLIHASFQVP